MKIYRLEDLKDSRILYEKKIPQFGFAMIIIVLVLIIITAIWMANCKKTFVVKGNGIVESENKNYIMAPYAGKITKLNIKEGKIVSKGDVVAIISSTEKEMQKEQNNFQKKQLNVAENNLEKQIRLNERLVRSIQDNVNYFYSDNSDERYYYNQYELYKNQRFQINKDKEEGVVRKEELYRQTLSDVENRISEYKNELTDVSVQLRSYEDMNKPAKIKAPTNGTIHMMDAYKKGMELQAGAIIASVSAQNEKYVIKAQVSAADRARIKVNSNVEMEFAGLAQSVFGTINGKIIGIDTDITIAQNGESDRDGGFFNVSILPEKNYLVSKDGEVVNITAGMEVEARMTYDKISYLSYVAQAIGIKSE